MLFAMMPCSLLSQNIVNTIKNFPKYSCVIRNQQITLNERCQLVVQEHSFEPSDF